MKQPPFAKLFETTHGQLLVTKEYDDDEGEGLCLRFDGDITVELTSRFASAADRNVAFANIDQALAEDQAARLAAMSARLSVDCAQ